MTDGLEPTAEEGPADYTAEALGRARGEVGRLRHELALLKSELFVVIRGEHRKRCLMDGCYYGTADKCAWCGEQRPNNDRLLGKSPLA